MNVYDFDGTIYSGDSTIDFYFWELKKHPVIMKAFCKQVMGVLKYAVKMIDKTGMKSEFFSFLKYIDSVDEDVALFWEENEDKIENWYIEQKEVSDVVISASPEFLLEPICTKLHIADLIATNVDKSTGKIYGENCRGEEKVKRFSTKYKNMNVEKFYSDSRSDAPMASLANEAYFIKKGKIESWG